jgi:hypothetical protein
MDQLTREHKPPLIAGMWVRLWVEEVVLSAEFWLARGASFALSTLQAYLRRPVLYTGTALVAGVCTFACTMNLVPERAGRYRTVQLDEKAIIDGVELYTQEQGHLPARLEALVPTYLKDLHNDPWGRPYAFYQGEGGAAVVSAGPDGKLGTGDDILYRER